MTSITSWRRASQLVSTTRRQTTVSLTVWLPSHDSSCWRHAWRTNKRQWSHDASHVRYVMTTVSLTLMSHTPPTKQQHMLTIPPQIACASALPGKTGKYENCIFDSNAELLHCMNSTICLIYFSHLTYDSYSRCCMTPYINAFRSGLLGAWFRINEVESAA